MGRFAPINRIHGPSACGISFALSGVSNFPCCERGLCHACRRCASSISPASRARGRARLCCVAFPPARKTVVKLGLIAAMSGQSAKSGEAIVRGLSLAIDEINARAASWARRSSSSSATTKAIPPRASIAARELVQREKVAALFGGLDTPVSMAIVPFANQDKVPFMGVWAAGTPITRNGATGELRLPCLGGRRIGGQGAGRLRDREIPGQEARA